MLIKKQNLTIGTNITKSITFPNYFNSWIRTYKGAKLAYATLHRYQVTQKVIQHEFAGVNIKLINRQQYQKFINKLGVTHAPSSVTKANVLIRAVVNSAISDDYLTKNFTKEVSIVANPAKTIKVGYLNLDEIHRLIETTSSKKITSRRYTSRYMILTAIYTGMRLSEIQGLTWNDIDFIHATTNINKSWDAINHCFKPTKNESSIRKIKINRKLVQVLKRLKVNAPSTMVFINQNGTIPTSNAVNKTLRAILSDLKIHRRGFHFHSLRHSHVALLLANGINLYAISKRLGHSSTATTSKVYAYLIDEYKDETDQAIVKALDNL